LFGWGRPHPSALTAWVFSLLDGAAVKAVGDKERVIAGTDCGFGTFASYEFIAEDVVWAKLKSLSEGAAIVSGKLWGKAKAAGASKSAVTGKAKKKA
jgi:hypothetical protein